MTKKYVVTIAQVDEVKIIVDSDSGIQHATDEAKRLWRKIYASPRRTKIEVLPPDPADAGLNPL